MTEIFVIFGYGIPKDILKDENYRIYLKLVLNSVYSLVLEKKVKKPLLIFTGGKTDIYRPYKRDEAREMICLFKELTKRKDLRQIVKNWQLVNESQALSTLENIINTKEYLASKKIKKANLNIFCEKTRKKKVEIFAHKVLAQKYKYQVIPIDFDFSPSRYLKPDFIQDKEVKEIKFGLWALKNQANFKKFHHAYVDRLNFFHKNGPQKHLQSIHQWWDKELNEIIS